MLIFGILVYVGLKVKNVKKEEKDVEMCENKKEKPKKGVYMKIFGT